MYMHVKLTHDYYGKAYYECISYILPTFEYVYKKISYNT